MICTYTLKEAGDNSTQLVLSVNGSGDFNDEIPELVKGVWEHFLWEQFKPHIEKHYHSSRETD
jgi:hypothetical protein